MGVEGVYYSDSEAGSMQAMKNKNQYRKRSKDMSKGEVQHVNKQQEDEEALKRVREIYPQCSECIYWRSTLMMHLGCSQHCNEAY